jgi:hypothetical protein
MSKPNPLTYKLDCQILKNHLILNLLRIEPQILKLGGLNGVLAACPETVLLHELLSGKPG